MNRREIIQSSQFLIPLCLLLCTSALCCKPNAPTTSPSASFFKPVTPELQLPAPPSNQCTLEDDLIFTDPNGKPWRAPKGTLTDGASIPRWLLSALGSNWDSSLADAAVVHDAYCGQANANGPSFHTDTWQNVHHMFYDGCLACGCSQGKAKVLYFGLLIGGPRWDGVASAAPTPAAPPPPALTPAPPPPAPATAAFTAPHEMALRRPSTTLPARIPSTQKLNSDIADGKEWIQEKDPPLGDIEICAEQVLDAQRAKP